MHILFLNECDRINIAQTESISKLKNFALEYIDGLIKKYPSRDIHQVCGPMSNGGVGSLKGNLNTFRKAIQELWVYQEKIVFDQLPFEGKLRELKESPLYKGDSLAVLEGFYLPIFKSGKITVLDFLPAWETSEGARWEYEKGEELKLEIRCFPTYWDSRYKKESVYAETAF